MTEGPEPAKRASHGAAASHSRRKRESKRLSREEREIQAHLVPEPSPAAPPRLGLLAGSSPEAILAKITQGDPLRLHEMCGRRVRELSLLLDPDRLHEHSLSWIAVAATRAASGEIDSGWLTRMVDCTIERCLREDREQQHVAPGSPPADLKHYSFIHEAFGTESGLVRSAAVAFNALEQRARRGFFALLVEGKSVEECLEEGLGPREMLRDNVLQALCALGHLNQEELEYMRRRSRR